MNNINQISKTIEQTTNHSTELNFIQEMAKFMDDGGVFMWIIFFIWSFGVVVAIERLKNLINYDTDGNSLMNAIKKNIITNNVQSAIQDCSKSSSLLAKVMKNGLHRANGTKDQIKDALEASILEIVPKVEKRLNYLSLIANISTLIGLLGTIYGLIQSFAAVAAADPASKAKLLAMGISKAMNTTAFGLISAISIMIIHSYLVNKSDKIISESEQFSVKLLDILSIRKVKSND